MTCQAKPVLVPVRYDDEGLLPSLLCQAQADHGRRALLVSDILRDVCITGLTTSQLLHKAGWSRSPSFTKTTMAALCAALDRMRAASEFS